MPGSTAGWQTDVDSDGDRMNPNKLLFDPYAVELSHDPETPTQPSGSAYATGNSRAIDSAPVAPKGIVLPDGTSGVGDIGAKPTRAFADDIIYEVHVRGFTQADPQPARAPAPTPVPRPARRISRASASPRSSCCRSPRPRTTATTSRRPTTTATTTGATRRSRYFAPDRRYACDKSPGGPTRELRAMVKAFHDAGIKVLVDVVYNHTAEGGGGVAALAARPRQRRLLRARQRRHRLHEFERRRRGSRGHQAARREGSCSTRCATGPTSSASTASGSTSRRCSATSCGTGCFAFDPTGLPTLIAARARPADGGAGVDLIAEPWAVVANSYPIGNFPAGWSEWNDHFRDTVREDQNEVGTTAVTPSALATRIAGSSDLFGARAPVAGVELPRLARRLHAARRLRVQRAEQRPGVAVRSVERRQRRPTTRGITAAIRSRSARRRAPGSRSSCSRPACR